MEDHWAHHDYVDQTTLHPIGFAAIMVLGFASLVLPRRFALIPIILSACFIAPAQRVVILTLDFNMLRIMVVFGWTRMVLRGESAGFVWKRIDTVMILWMISGATAFILLRGNMPAVIYKLGVAFDAAGMYLFFRCVIRSWKDVDTIVLCFSIVSIPVAIAFLVESSTGRNAFAVLGGVPEITPIRQGKLRCQGAFAHPIIAGCFWASLMPLIAARWWGNGSARVWGVIGLVTSMVIIATCASSTPVIGVLAGVLAAFAFTLRRHMRAIRWGALATVIGLHLVMNAPVWHLIGRVHIVGGSTGYHRYLVIQRAVDHFGEWWLMGCRSTLHWAGVYKGDITNQFVLEGVRGGLLTMILFILVISAAFGAVGRIWRESGGHRARVALAWGLGATLFVHCTSFVGVSYFGQILLVWYLPLAAIGSLDRGTAACAKGAAAPNLNTPNPAQLSNEIAYS